MHVIFAYFARDGFGTKIKCLWNVQSKSDTVAAVSACTKISCVRKFREPGIRKLSVYEIFWIYSINNDERHAGPLAEQPLHLFNIIGTTKIEVSKIPSWGKKDIQPLKFLDSNRRRVKNHSLFSTGFHSPGDVHVYLKGAHKRANTHTPTHTFKFTFTQNCTAKRHTNEHTHPHASPNTKLHDTSGCTHIHTHPHKHVQMTQACTQTYTHVRKQTIQWFSEVEMLITNSWKQ